MSAFDLAPLRLALLSHALAECPGDPAAQAATELATALAAAGHKPTVITCHRAATEVAFEDGVRVVRVRRLPEAPLRARGFATPVTQTPFTFAALRAGRFGLAHAFSPADVMAALLWRRLGGGPVVFTCVEPPCRAALADRRQRLRMLTAAFEHSDVVTAASTAARDAIRRWIALDVAVLETHHQAAYESLYRAQM